MVNGNGKTVSQILAELSFHERVERQVEKRLAEEREREQQERTQEAERRMLGVRRGSLSPAEKSRIIQERGLDFYQGLPW